MKTFLISFLAAIALIPLIGCSCDHHQDANQSASMQTDSKDMTPRHHHHHMDQ